MGLQASGASLGMANQLAAIQQAKRKTMITSDDTSNEAGNQKAGSRMAFDTAKFYQGERIEEYGEDDDNFDSYDTGRSSEQSRLFLGKSDKSKMLQT